MDAVDSPSSSCVIVPRGWSREVTEENVYYVSPVGNVLRTRDELFIYLMTDGTCKCGLRCPFQVDVQFSFDPSVLSLPDHGDPDSLCKRANVDCCSAKTTPTGVTPPPFMAALASDCYLRTRNGSDMILKRSPTPQELKKHNYRQYSLTGFSPNGVDDVPLKSPRKGVKSPERGPRMHLRSRRSLSADFEKPLTEFAKLKPHSNHENLPSNESSNSAADSNLVNLSSSHSRFSSASPSLATPVTSNSDLPSAKSLSHQLNTITKSHLELISLLHSVSSHLKNSDSSSVVETQPKRPKLQPKPPSLDERGGVREGVIFGGYHMGRKPRKAKMDAAARLLSLAANSPPRESGRDSGTRAPLKPSQPPASLRDISPRHGEVPKSASNSEVDPTVLPANLNFCKKRGVSASAWKEPEPREMSSSTSCSEANSTVLPANLNASKTSGVSEALSLPRTAAPSIKMDATNPAASGALKPLPGNFAMLRVPSLSLPKTCVVSASSRAASLPLDKMEEVSVKRRRLEFPDPRATTFLSLRAVSVPPEDPHIRTGGRQRALSCSSSPTSDSSSRRRHTSVTPDRNPLPYKNPLPGKLRDVQLKDFHISLTNYTPRKKLESGGNGIGGTGTVMDSKPACRNKQRPMISKRQLSWSKRLHRHTVDHVGLKKIKKQAEKERPDALATEILEPSSDALPVDSVPSSETGHVNAGGLEPADHATPYGLTSTCHVTDTSGHVTSHVTAPSSHLMDGTANDFSMDTATSQAVKSFEDLDMKFFAALPNMTFDFAPLDPDLPSPEVMQSRVSNSSSMEVENEVGSSWSAPTSGNETAELHSTPHSGPTAISVEVTPSLEPENQPTGKPEHQSSKLLGTEGMSKSERERESRLEFSTGHKGVVSLSGLTADTVSLSAPASDIGREGALDSSPTTGISPPTPPPPPSHDTTHLSTSSNSASNSSYLTPPSNFGSSILTTPSPPVDSSVHTATPQDAESAIILPLTPLSAGSTDLAPPTVDPCLTHPTSTSTLTPSGPCSTPPTFNSSLISSGQDPNLISPTVRPSLTLPTADQPLTPSAEELPLTPPSADFSVTSKSEDVFSSAATISKEDKSFPETPKKEDDNSEDLDFGKDLNVTISKEDKSCSESLKKQDDNSESVVWQAEDFGEDSNEVVDMELDSDSDMHAAVDDFDDQYGNVLKDRNLDPHVDVLKDRDLDPDRKEVENLDLHGGRDVVKESDLDPDVNVKEDEGLDPNANTEDRENVAGEMNPDQDDANMVLNSEECADSNHLVELETTTSNSADKLLDSIPDQKTSTATSESLLPLETFLSCEETAREGASASPSLSSVHQLQTPCMVQDTKESHDTAEVSHETAKKSLEASKESHEGSHEESHEAAMESHEAAMEAHEATKESHETAEESPKATTGAKTPKTGKRGRPRKKVRKPPSKKTKKAVADVTMDSAAEMPATGMKKTAQKLSNIESPIGTEPAEEGLIASEKNEPVVDTESSPCDLSHKEIARGLESATTSILKDENPSSKSQANATSESTPQNFESQRQCNLHETESSMDEGVSSVVGSHGVELQSLSATKANTATSVSTLHRNVSDEGSKEEAELQGESNMHSSEDLQETDVCRKREATDPLSADSSAPNAKRMKLMGNVDSSVAAESCNESDVVATSLVSAAGMEESISVMQDVAEMNCKNKSVAEMDSNVAPEIVATSRAEETVDVVALNVVGEGIGVSSDVAATVSATVKAIVAATSSVAGSCIPTTSNAATKSSITGTDYKPVSESVNESPNPPPKASSEERKVRRKRFDFVYKAYPIRSRGGSSVSATPPNSHSPSPSFATPSEASSSFKLFTTPKTSAKPKSSSNSKPKSLPKSSKGKLVSPKGNARKRLVENRKSSVSAEQSDNDFSAVLEDFLGSEKSPETELIVSIPLRMGKKIVAHHTLLPCSETDTPTTPPTPHIPIKLGSLVWAKGNQMPGWPGRIVSHKKRKLAEPSADKVWVEWFGEASVSLVNKNSIKGLKEGISKRLKLRKALSKDLKIAIEEAIAQQQ